MGVHEICRWGSCTYTTTNNMFDIMRDLKRVDIDPVQAVVPSNILVDIPQPAPLNDVLYKLGFELYALWSVGYINDPDIAFSDFDT